MRRRTGTPPDSLVLRILESKRFTSAALEWGIQNEPIAIRKYVEMQHDQCHNGLTAFPSGFIISESYSFLGATPDGSVYDPSSHEQPYGFLEVKCPYSKRNVTPEDACTSPDICCVIDSSSPGERKLRLKRNRIYYAQVQGQMGIGERQWCDFVIYTSKGVNIEGVNFDQHFWKYELLPKLISFYDNSVAPEIVSPVHVLGLPVRDLRKD